MFRIFDRSLARQIIGATLFAVIILSVVLVLGQILRKLLDQVVGGQLSPMDMLRFIGYAFPWSLSYTVPWGVLTATLLLFGRLSADYELVALRMAGLSLWRIATPVLVVAALLSIFCFWINTDVAPRSYSEGRKLTQQAILRNPNALFQADKVVSEISGHLIFAEKREGNTLRNLQIVQFDGANESRSKPSTLILAERGVLGTADLKDKREFPITLQEATFLKRTWPAPPPADASQEERDAAAARIREDIVGPPKVLEFFSSDSPFAISLRRIIERGERVRSEGLTMAELQTILQDRDAFAQANPTALANRTPEMFASEVHTEYHKRISFSFACFVLALIGIPFGIVAQRKETSSGFVFSLGIGIAYFTLIMVGELWKDQANKMPHLWVWLPNVLFGFVGIALMVRLARR
jgi:lipopolysaccharide export LptBFGC system permease protein LptF